MTKETPTLEPLDLSAVISSTEPPELKEFKKRVIEVAKQHSSSMHCGEYKSVLRQLGIKEGEDKVKVELETAFGMVFTVETDPTKLHEKTVDEQKKVLLDTLGTLSLTSGNKSVGVMSVSADSVVRMTLVSTATPFANALDTPSGVWLYGGPDGRVRHFFEGVQETRAHGYVHTRNGANVTYPTAICGFSTFSGPRMTAIYGKNRNCAKCEARYDRDWAARDIAIQSRDAVAAP